MQLMYNTHKNASYNSIKMLDHNNLQQFKEALILRLFTNKGQITKCSSFSRFSQKHLSEFYFTFLFMLSFINNYTFFIISYSFPLFDLFSYYLEAHLTVVLPLLTSFDFISLPYPISISIPFLFFFNFL